MRRHAPNASVFAIDGRNLSPRCSSSIGSQLQKAVVNLNRSAVRQFEPVGSIEKKTHNFFFPRWGLLRVNPALAFLARETATKHQAFELPLGPAVTHNNFVKPPITARLDH